VRSNEQLGAATRVGVRVVAQYARLAMLRALTETVLLLGELTLDEVTEIQVALDEIVTGLMDAAVEGSTIDCDFQFYDGRITVCITAVAASQEVIDEEGFGWHVIRTVTESLKATIGSFDQFSGGYPITIEFARADGSPR
jgi:serine/threonine-protein kinase RsbW